MHLKATVTGNGYVGLVSGTCLAEVGKDILWLEVALAKVKIPEVGGFRFLSRVRRRWLAAEVLSANGRERFHREFNWPHVLSQYEDLLAKYLPGR